MNPREFYDLVVEMRAKQKEYFKTRNNTVKNEAILLERKVDAEIARVEKIINPPAQGELFTDE